MQGGLKKTVGTSAELQACQFLEKQGMTLLERNFTCKMGEIDLIMQDKQAIIFVEVRSREKFNYGHPIESVTLQKQKKIIRAATSYLLLHNWFDKIDCRFDIVSVNLANVNHPIEWIENAFSMDYL